MKWKILVKGKVHRARRKFFQKLSTCKSRIYIGAGRACELKTIDSPPHPEKPLLVTQISFFRYSDLLAGEAIKRDGAAPISHAEDVVRLLPARVPAQAPDGAGLDIRLPY